MPAGFRIHSGANTESANAVVPASSRTLNVPGIVDKNDLNRDRCVSPLSAVYPQSGWVRGESSTRVERSGKPRCSNHRRMRGEGKRVSTMAVQAVDVFFPVSDAARRREPQQACMGPRCGRSHLAKGGSATRWPLQEVRECVSAKRRSINPRQPGSLIKKSVHKAKNMSLLTANLSK